MLTLCFFMSIGAPALVRATTEKGSNISNANSFDREKESNNILGLPNADGTGNASKKIPLLEDFQNSADIIVNEINF